MEIVVDLVDHVATIDGMETQCPCKRCSSNRRRKVQRRLASVNRTLAWMRTWRLEVYRPEQTEAGDG